MKVLITDMSLVVSSQTYQQPLDITVGENEEVFFVVTGTHAVTLTGNFIESLDDEESEYDSDEDGDLDLLGAGDSDDESDDLDDIDNPRVTEVDSDEEEAPKLVAKKGKNKRAADEEAESLDALIAAGGKEDAKLSKKQAKKLKNNKGEAIAAEEAKAKKDGKELVAEAVEEHHVVKVLLGELSAMSAEDESFDAKVTVLMENVRHHVEEEESELLPQSEELLGDEELARLGEEMAARKKQLGAD